MTEQRSALIAIVSKDDGKKAVGLDWQNNNSALANHAFLYILLQSLPVYLRRETSQFRVLWRTGTQDTIFFFLL